MACLFENLAIVTLDYAVLKWYNIVGFNTKIL